jgi:hypothetical protein
VTEIHDLGTTRYEGPRTPQGRRFGTVARNVFGVSWRSRWGVKFPILISITTTIAASVVMYVLRDKLATTVRRRGVPLPRAEQIIFFAESFYQFSGFLLTTVVACASIANDLRLGAFQFYFARPIRKRDYVAGKLLGLALVVGVPMFAGPMTLAIVRLLFADSARQALDLAPILLRALALGLVGTTVFVMTGAGLGAMTRKKEPAQALFAIYFLLIAPAAQAISVPLEIPSIRALSLSQDIMVIGRKLFGVPLDRFDPPVALAALAALTLAGAGFALVVQRVRSAEVAGLGQS